jgi:nicotinamidase-related amidase
MSRTPIWRALTAPHCQPTSSAATTPGRPSIVGCTTRSFRAPPTFWRGFRRHGIECLFARIACHTKDGRDRSLSQKMPGWNNLLLPRGEAPSQLVPELAPTDDEIVVTKTTDSALTGTNLRLILHNLGIKNVVCAGIFTDQCVSSTVRSLADESYNVVVVEDCCAAGSDELHRKELEIINMIYCHVMSSAELIQMMRL